MHIQLFTTEMIESQYYQDSCKTAIRKQSKFVTISNMLEYKSNGDKDKILSVRE